jgi:hypothetical protein
MVSILILETYDQSQRAVGWQALAVRGRTREIVLQGKRPYTPASGKQVHSSQRYAGFLSPLAAAHVHLVGARIQAR